VRLSLKCEIILKDVLSSKTRINIEELWREKFIWTLKCESCFADETVTENLANRTAQSDSRLEILIILSSIVHTRSESP